MIRLSADLRAAFGLLTRLPLARPGGSTDLTGGVWAFPLVGLAVNGAGGVVYWLLHRFGMPPLPDAAWSLAATMIMTGALHEDGLADTADGFGGGPTKERKLEIMRDHHIGSYGTLALLLSVAIRVGAIAALATPFQVFIGFCAAGPLGRAAMLLLMLVLEPARGDGLGAAMRGAGVARIALGLAIAVVMSLALLPFWTVLAACCASASFAWLAHQQIGGYTGDVLGASEVVTECVVLSVFASLLRA